MSSHRIPIHERAETVAFVWPPEGAQPVPKSIAECQLHFRTDRDWFHHVQAASGWRVTDEQWTQLLSELVPDSMVFATAANEPVAVACALAREDRWQELAWVAVAAKHRGQRLGKLVCSTLVRQLITSGERLIYCSTQDERLAAIRIYLEMGFHPVHRPDKIDRWQTICGHLDWPFTPQAWGWPGDAVG